MTFSPDLGIFAKQLRQLGVNIAWVGSPSTVTPTAVRLAGPALYGSYAVADFAADSSPAAKEFASKYEATYKSAPEFLGAWTYDAVHGHLNLGDSCGAAAPTLRRLKRHALRSTIGAQPW